MNKVKLLSIAVVGLLLLNLGVLAFLCFRQPPPPGRGPRGEEPKLIIIRKLHFDQAQQDAYQLLIDAHRSNMRAFDRRSYELKNDLYALLKTPNPDTSLVKSAVQQIAAVQQAQERVNFEHFQKIRMLCKPSQLADFDELVNELTDIFAPPEPHKR